MASGAGLADLNRLPFRDCPKDNRPLSARDIDNSITCSTPCQIVCLGEE